MGKLRIGILGCNFMGKMHADCYRMMEDVQVVAVADLNEEVAASVAKSWNAKVFKDADKLIEEMDLDALDICLPTFLHTRFALKAMEKVPYLFIEKPVALNLEDCEVLLAKQKETGAKIQIGHVIRFWDEYTYLKKIVEEKSYGEVVNATFRRLSPSPTWSTNNWRQDGKLCGGAVVDLHIHDIDYMLYLFGNPKNSHCVRNRIGEPNSYITTICEYDSFAVSVEGTWFLPSSYPFEMYYRVVFEKAVLEFKQGQVTIYDQTGSRKVDIAKKEISVGSFTEGNISELGGYYNELKYFTDCIKNNCSIEKASLIDGIKSLEFILNELKTN